MSTEPELRYNVVVDSVGSALPEVSKMLSEGLKLPVELVTKAIYNAPSVLFLEVDRKVAEDAIVLLEHLGLEASMSKAGDPLPELATPVEIGVYINDIFKLSTVRNQLSDFLACEPNQALSLLANEPGIVLGGVSEATAKALANRLDAEVMVSNPLKDLFLIDVVDPDMHLLSQLKASFKSHGIDYDPEQSPFVDNLNYKVAQDIWKRFQHTKKIKIINQSFQRFEIVLESVDTSLPGYKTALVELTGMPEEIVDQVVANLPIQLDESVSRANLDEKISAYAAQGLDCTGYYIPPRTCFIRLDEIGDIDQTKKVLDTYFDKVEIPETTSSWKSPTPLPKLIARYAAAQLQVSGCEVELEIT